MSAPNVPPRRVSMSYLLGFSKTPFKDPKPPPVCHGPRPGGLGDMVSTPGGIVEWAASDGRKGRLNGPGKTRAFSEGATKGPSGKGEQAANGKQADRKEEAKAGGEDADEDDNPHGFTKAEDEKMVEWKTANPGKPWTDFGNEIGKSGPQCKERYKQISSKDGNQNAGQQQGGKGGGGGQQNQQPRKLTNKEKKALKQGGGCGQNKKEGDWNDQNNGQTWEGNAGGSGNSIAGQGDAGDTWGAGFDLFAEPGGGDVKNDGDKKDSSSKTGNNNDPNNTWGAPTTSGNVADNAGWPTSGATGGWDGGGGGGDNNAWDINKGGSTTNSDGKKKEKKEKKDKGKGSKKDGDNWSQNNDSSGGGNPGWGDTTGGDNLWGNGSNKSGAGKSGGSSSNETASQGEWPSGGGDTGGGGGGGWVTDGANDGPGWGEQNDKPTSNKGRGGDAPWGGPAGTDGAGGGANAWNAQVADNPPPTNGGGFGGGGWNTTTPPAASVKKAPSHHQSHKSARQHSPHGNQSSKDRTAAPLELEVRPDETFSVDDLRLVARILQQDYQMVWHRVSWRFKDKTGRNVLPEVFEKKITGRVEGEERERSERKKRR